MCSVESCDGPTLARGWCSKHYQRWKNHGDPLGGKPGPTVRKVVALPDGSRCCTACQVVQPVEHFDRDKNASDGCRSHCKACRSARMKRWYAENRERQCDKQRDRFIANRAAIRQGDRERYERHHARRLELAKAATHKRRIALRRGEYEPGISVARLRARDGDQCCYCRCVMSFVPVRGHKHNPIRATLEHVVPLSRGGGHTWLNTALACWRCNVRKNALTLSEWEAAASAAIVAAEKVRKQGSETVDAAAS